MKTYFRKRLTLLIYLFTLIVCSADEQKFYTKLSWSEINNLPRDLSFEGEIAGYLSIFKSNESWHIYLYKDRESLLEHNELNFVRINELSFRSTLAIEDFSERENLLKSLDQRFVRISGKFKKSESAVSSVPIYNDTIASLKWRGGDGNWTSDFENGLGGSPFKAGRVLRFPDAVFFEHAR
jgi:hypothetical protein